MKGIVEMFFYFIVARLLVRSMGRGYCVSQYVVFASHAQFCGCEA
jgi:hypothetical protein